MHSERVLYCAPQLVQPLQDVELTHERRAVRGRLSVEAAALQVGTVLMQAVERVDETRLVSVRVRVGVSRQKPDCTGARTSHRVAWGAGDE